MAETISTDMYRFTPAAQPDYDAMAARRQQADLAQREFALKEQQANQNMMIQRQQFANGQASAAAARKETAERDKFAQDVGTINNAFLKPQYSPDVTRTQFGLTGQEQIDTRPGGASDAGQESTRPTQEQFTTTEQGAQKPIDAAGWTQAVIAANPKYGPDYAKKIGEVVEQREKWLKATEENRVKVAEGAWEQYKPIIAGINRVEDVAPAITAIYNDPTIGGPMRQIKTLERAILDAQASYRYNPDGFKATMTNLSGKDMIQMTSTAPTISQMDVGGKVIYVQTNPRAVGPDGQPVPVGTQMGVGQDKTLTPQEQQKPDAPKAQSDSGKLHFDAAHARELAKTNRAAGNTAQADQYDKIADALEKQAGDAAEGFPPLKPMDKFKMEADLGKSQKTTVSLLDKLEDAHDAVQNVQASDLSGSTGLQSYIPSYPDSKAATADTRMKTLEGKITDFGKTAAASSGAIGAMAVKEWEIVRDMVAALRPEKGEASYREQISNIEGQIQRSKQTLREAYAREHQDTLRRPEFKQHGVLPEARERGEATPGSHPEAQKPFVNRVRPNSSAPAPAPAPAPAGAAPAGGNVDFNSW